MRALCISLETITCIVGLVVLVVHGHLWWAWLMVLLILCIGESATREDGTP